MPNTETNNIWKQIKAKYPKGFFCLAPMADVTDNPFRKILSEIGVPNVYFNEFIAADGLVHPVGRLKLERMLNFEEEQRPIIAQIFSGNPSSCRDAAKICAQHKYNGIDINMGCPVKNITKQTSGSELCKPEHRELVAEIIKATREGAGSMPVSVKTRIGFNSIDLTWIQFLLEQNLPVLTVHLRTKKEMSKVPAHWELMTEIREMRDKTSPETLLVGNGDIESTKQGFGLIEKYGIDGVMVGRALFTNPWLFGNLRAASPQVEERIELALRHTRYYIEEYTIEGELTKSFNLMKKFYKVYINGFPGAKELRVELMAANSYEEVETICQKFLKG